MQLREQSDQGQLCHSVSMFWKHARFYGKTTLCEILGWLQQFYGCPNFRTFMVTIQVIVIQSFVYCRVFVLLIIDYSTKKGVLVYSRKCASAIVYFRSNPYRKQCELMYKQVLLLYYSFHVTLGDKTEKRHDLFCAWKSRVQIPHWYSLSLSSVIFYVVSIITAWQRTLLMKILICDYIICDRPFSHMEQEYPFLWLPDIFLSRPACLIQG